jgi:hypothetical protein
VEKMVLSKLVGEVDAEKLYKHVLQTQGIKHPIVTPQRLNEVGDYIKNELKNYGLKTKEHTFRVKGFASTFRNIEGVIGEGLSPEILVTSHYDTVATTPGANDNGSGIASMLEAARLLSRIEPKKTIRFVSFTLEELNPTREAKTRALAQELGLVTKEQFYQTWHSQKVAKKIYGLRAKALFKGKTNAEAWEESYDQLKNSLTAAEQKYLKLLVKLYSQDTRETWLGQSALVGSNRWLENALEEEKNIAAMVNLETIGYTSNRKHSQISPFGPLMYLFPRYKVKVRKRVGNFIVIAADRNSRKLAKAFRKQCKRQVIDLPCLQAQMPMNFQGIAKRARDLLRSDHGPFWRANIPALMITDTANFRYPYYHTRADTIDKLNFDFIKKVTQATIATTQTLDSSFFPTQ